MKISRESSASRGSFDATTCGKVLVSAANTLLHPVGLPHGPRPHAFGEMARRQGRGASHEVAVMADRLDEVRRIAEGLAKARDTLTPPAAE